MLRIGLTMQITAAIPGQIITDHLLIRRQRHIVKAVGHVVAVKDHVFDAYLHIIFWRTVAYGVFCISDGLLNFATNKFSRFVEF